MPKKTTSSEPAQPLSLDTLLIASKLVGDATAAALAGALGISTVGELLRHFPRRYEDRTHFAAIAQVPHGAAVTISGTIGNVESNRIRANMTVIRVAVRDDTGTAYLVFFNQWYAKAQFERLRGTNIVAYGKASRRSVRGLELTDVEWEKIEADKDTLSVNRIVPIYPLAEGLSQNRMRKLLWTALDRTAYLLPDIVPTAIRLRQSLPDAIDATQNIHYPVSATALANAQRAFVFTEFYTLQVALIGRKRRVTAATGHAFANVIEPVATLKAALPYSLTGAQNRVVAEIVADLARSIPMNRLVQGDVGSGKTAVAMAAMLTAVHNGAQTALMAPTEILAEQHYLNIHRTIEGLGMTVALLNGSMTAKEKLDAYERLASGDIQIAVGTHALIQEGVTFARLGLAIVDEQHRFGVLQRAALKDKGQSPHVLVMTATPIPRTLTMTVYGDLDVSIIDELPPGRKPVRTHWKKPAERPQVYETLRGMLRQGRQAYVICPLILESDKLQVRAASELAAHLAAHVFPEYKIGLLHGQMKPAEKEEALLGFRDRAYDVLVSTTVVEVGVDVPNASVILIEDADRFGLAQLHQLRGRVGRGETQSYCILIADPKTPEGEARMEIMTKTTDGFVIAEEDLKLRGPGEFYGLRQSGAQDLPFLDVIRDVPVLQEARREAIATLDADPKLADPDHAPLREQVRSRLRAMSGPGGA